MRRIIGAFIVLQIASIALYQLAASLEDYGELWNGLPLLRTAPFEIAQWVFILAAEAVLIFFAVRFASRRAPEQAPEELVRSDEHERLERKSTFRWDVRAGTVNKALEKASMKTIAAFMNSQGGHLVLGVGDGGEAVGMEHDYASLPRRDADGFQNHFSNVLSAMIGPSFRQFVRVRQFDHEGKECTLVSVRPADRPAYVKDHENEEFFIRTGNGTTALRISEANAYINSRFSTK